MTRVTGLPQKRRIIWAESTMHKRQESPLLQWGKRCGGGCGEEASCQTKTKLSRVQRSSAARVLILQNGAASELSGSGHGG